VASPLPGPAGNVEFFLWLRATPAAAGEDVAAPSRRAA
jgi:23S rRNA (cytidine1920-2'-O)/16S rRNA (cytidine1409-2'-O)-methyltransferase